MQQDDAIVAGSTFEGELQPSLQRLVQISGIETAVPYRGESAAEVPVVGKLGRVLDPDVGGGKCLVEMLDDGLLFELPDENLTTHQANVEEDGAFDLAWPYGDEGLAEFGWEVSNLVGMRGWCSLQVPRHTELRQRAADRAARLPWAKPKRELLPDYIGHRGVGKVTEIDPLSLLDEEKLSRRLASGLPEDPVERFDADLSGLFLAMAPSTWAALGFTTSGRTGAMAWAPFSSSSERAALEPEDLEEEDVEEGVLKKHLHFLRRRRLCFLYLVNTEGGRLSLYSQNGLKKDQAINIPVGPGRLLVFRCDKFTFRYEPSGEHLTLASWALEEPPKMELSCIDGEPRARDELFGILRGPGAPYHECARLLSLACWTGGAVFNSASAFNMYMGGTDGGVKVPFTRFDTDFYFCSNGDEDHKPGVNSYHIHGGLCADEVVMGFDYEFFGIDEDEAVIMCPNQRKVMEVGYEALHGAGFSKESLKGCPIMMYLGDCGTEWASQLVSMRLLGTFADHKPYAPKNKDVSQLDWAGATNLATLATRLSYSLGTTGPVCHLDTACSAGLTAFCTAMYSLRSDKLASTLCSRVQGALAGGVNQVLDPCIYVGNSAQHMLSLKGRCFTFDASGDGYGRGEGTSMAYATFGKDERDMQLQEGCAVGNKVNQDGRSASMTAPNGPAQQMCIQASLREAQVKPHDITASECHGTGTSLGDPIEVGALRGVQETDTRDDNLMCTSSKSNIGHLEANAGVTGLIKCLLLGKFAAASPNVHLLRLNPHLDVNGWPAVFETEICDLAQNSGLTGVSSFGVSGTNAHAEVWAMCQKGPNAAWRFASTGDVEKLDQIRVTCPVTLGPIDYLTGEPIVSRLKVGGPGGEEPLSGPADVLREELAPYDVSSHAFRGAYRYRAAGLAEVGEELEPGMSLFICGSWSGWRKQEEMVLQEDGSYLSTMILGDTRSESFSLCLNKSPSLRIYPAINNATPHISVSGPDDQGEGKRWIIDGRDEQIPAGTVYQIRFWWGSEHMEISWEEVSPKYAEFAVRYQHRYSVIGTWTTWTPQEMLKDLDEDGVWEASLRIGPTGREEFQVVRDADPQQVIYPARPGATSADVPVRGPDGLGKGKHWLLRGRPDERARIRLEVDDGVITVSASTGDGACTVWQNVGGWDRREYHLAGSWNDMATEVMVMDPKEPGIFRYRGSVGDAFSAEFAGFVEFFRIMIDADPGLAWYPELPYSRSGECIVHGPGGDTQDRVWMLRSWRAGAVFEIVLDLNAVDRRRIVSWTWEEPWALKFGAEAT